LGVTPADAAVFQDLAGHLFYANPSLRASPDELSRSHGSQPMLWAQGISGDWPIVLATLESEKGLPTLRQLFAAHRYWRRRGMKVDLVILNAHGPSYLQEFNEKIAATMFTATDSAVIDQPGGVFVRRRDLMVNDDLLMLRATARLHIPCDGHTLGTIVDASNDVGIEREEEDLLPSPPRPSGRHTPALGVRRIRIRATPEGPLDLAGADSRP